MKKAPTEAFDSASLDTTIPSDRLAFLPRTASQSRLAETLVALANATGGTILLGLDPRSRKPQGLSDPDAALDRALLAALSTDPPLVLPLPRRATVGDATILSVAVPQGLPHVYSYKGKYLVRDGVRNRPLDPRQLRRLMMERGSTGYESQVPDGARLDDVDWETVKAYLSALGGLPATDAQEALLRRGCLAEHDGELRPTLAGLLLFGANPQQWARSSEILVARYAGTKMDDRFVKQEIRGTLPQQIRGAEAFVQANVRKGVRLQGLERVETPEYPVEAVREAIVNAVAHRDYQIGGDQIRILLFSDRIEFYSPGRLPGHVTVENLVDERFSRNEVIVQVLSDMGYIERLGYGIDRMIRLVKEAGLAAPRFEETAAGFQVTLFGLGPALVTVPPAAQRWAHLGLNQRQTVAMDHLVEKGRITSHEYQRLCPDVSAETLRRDLAALVRKNLLLKIGDKRGTSYILKVEA
jgi:ATP-dependent DNA helicase RecG